MNTIGDITGFKYAWSMETKTKWLSEINSDPEIAQFPTIMVSKIQEVDAVLQEIDLTKIKLARYKRMKLSDLIDLSVLNSRSLEHQAEDLSVHGFLEKKITQVSEFISDSQIVMGSGPSNKDPHIILPSQLKSFQAHCNHIIIFGERVWPIIKRDEEARKSLRDARKIKRDAEKMTADLKREQAETSAAADELSQAFTSVQSLAGGTASDIAATYFLREAERHRKKANYWLVAVIIGAGLIASLSAYFYLCDWPKPTAHLRMIDWNNFIPKLSCLLIAIYFEIAILGNYRSERQNEVVNKHRSNALGTFLLMIESARTGEARDAITLNAANAIYAPQDTGFSRRTTPQQMSAADILGNMVNRRSD